MNKSPLHWLINKNGLAPHWVWVTPSTVLCPRLDLVRTREGELPPPPPPPQESLGSWENEMMHLYKER